jgi:high affinity Mn2+ porin
MDYSLHPLEPLAFRVTLAGPLGSIDTINLPAMAAALRRSVSPDPLRAANYDWTGLHVGAHVDSDWSKTSGGTVDTTTGTPSPLVNGNRANWHGGIQVGYDYMMPSRVVLGLEADISSGSNKVTNVTDAFGTSANEIRNLDSETVRGRLGYAVDNVLLFGTGGLAWSSNETIRTQLTSTLHLATAGTDEAVNNYLGGWTAGGGVAYTFLQNWNAFAEYRYTKYGSSTITLPFSALSTTSTTSVSAVELGVNYKFNWNLHRSRSRAY